MRVGRALMGIVLTGLAVEFALIPFALFHFHRAGLYGVAANVIAISSNTPTNGLNLVPEEQRGGLAAKEIRFDIAHSELLRRPEVATAVAELLS